MKRLTKLQTEFIDGKCKNGYIAFPLSIFKSIEYKSWKKIKRESQKLKTK